MRRAFACLFCILAAPVFAQEPFGTISGSLDGAAREWIAIEFTQLDETDASARVFSHNEQTVILLQGYSSTAGEATDSINIESVYFGDPASPQTPSSIYVAYFPDGMRNPYWTSVDVEEPVAQINFDFLDLTAPVGRAAGSISARLCLLDDPSGDPNPDNCVDFAATFDTSLLIEN